MNKRILGILLLTLSINSFAGIISSIENDDTNQYNKIHFELYEGGSTGNIYSSIAIQDDITGNVTNTSFDLPLFDFFKIFNSNLPVNVQATNLSYVATGSLGNRVITFTVNTYTEDGIIFSRSIATLNQVDDGYSASVQVFSRVNTPRRIYYPEGLILVATIDSNLSKAHEDGIDFYSKNGDLQGTVLSLQALQNLVNDKTISGIKKYCQANCLSN